MLSQFLSVVGKYTYFSVAKNVTSVLPCLACGQQIRTTFILKRRWPPGLHKNDTPPRLKARNYVYDLVEDTTRRKHEDIRVVLATYVEGLGNRGDIVSVKPTFGYQNLILPGLGVYCTPENVEKYTSGSHSKDVDEHSSPNAEKTVKFLSRLVLAVVMNKDMPWTLEPWHISMSFRKAGIAVPEKAITMPQYPIKGPDLSLENKQFLVKVTVNGLETAMVRCRIHHWSTTLADRLPFVEAHWRQKAEAIFPEEEEVMKSLPEVPPPRKAAKI
ncbi:39S ribosomal protein L9, mitochondrial [Ischnura elegans]|uniref:39S ribosomal protein L9, mitochondrial n=1 Tax=Ischnura elegans TaxID=197161 RepID=UPI001ED88A76|nr:39S ribosomal protein L9, mitochondrial [Ischnura elegans]